VSNYTKLGVSDDKHSIVFLPSINPVPGMYQTPWLDALFYTTHSKVRKSISVKIRKKQHCTPFIALHLRFRAYYW